MNNIDNNITLAKFLGWCYIPWNNLNNDYPGWWYKENILKKSPKIGYICRKNSELCFDSNWNRLMLVVDKIEKLKLIEDYTWEYEGKTYNNFKGFTVEISKDSCCIYSEFELNPPKTEIYCSYDSKREACYQACLEFVNTIYNKNNGTFCTWGPAPIS